MIHFSECFYKHALCLEILFSPISLKIDCFTYLSNQCIYNMPRSVVGYREKYRLPINTMPKKMANIWKGNMPNFFMYFLVGRNATFNLPPRCRSFFCMIDLIIGFWKLTTINKQTAALRFIYCSQFLIICFYILNEVQKWLRNK